MSLFKRESRQWAPEPMVSPWSVASTSGDWADMGAMQSSTVWACRHLVASTVSMMPLEPYTKRQGVRVPLDNVPSLLQRPSADATLPEWIYMLVGGLLTGGNTLGQIVARDSSQAPTQIEFPGLKLAPLQKGQPLAYTDANGAPFPERDVFHAKAYRVAGLRVGLSPLQYAAWAVARDKAIQRFSLGYFTDAPNPSGILTSDQPINETQAITLKKRWKASILGREPAILGAGLSFKPLSVTPEESQFLSTQKYGAAELCRFFNVPPSKIPGAEIASSMTYASVEANGLDFLTYSIQWWLTILEAQISALLPGNQHVMFNPSVLLRTDVETQAKTSAIRIASKQETPDEARALRDKPPLTQQQKDILGLVPLEISPGGAPKALPTAAGQQAAVTDTPSDISTDTEGTP